MRNHPFGLNAWIYEASKLYNQNSTTIILHGCHHLKEVHYRLIKRKDFLHLRTDTVSELIVALDNDTQIALAIVFGDECAAELKSMASNYRDVLHRVIFISITENHLLSDLQTSVPYTVITSVLDLYNDVDYLKRIGYLQRLMLKHAVEAGYRNKTEKIN